MLIGIDASRATKRIRTGTEYYSAEIIKALAKIDPKNQYILYSPLPPQTDLSNLASNFVFKIMPFPRLWSQIRLSFEFLFNKPDLVFEPAHTVPIIHPKVMVTTIHDLGFKHFPKLYTPFERKYHNFSANFSIKHSAYIITPSQFTKKDILRFYPIPKEKIRVIYHGYNAKLYRPLSKDSEAKKNHNFPYLFFVGRLEEKKNILGLLEAYRLLRNERQLKHKLVLAGKKGYGFDLIEKKIESLPRPIRKDVILLDYVPEDQLASFMRYGDVFVFPSFFEGFGFPVLEAMACGVPVVCSNVTSLPEIASNAAVLVDPKKPFEIAAAISKVIHNQSLRRSLIARGLKRASLFSWEKAASKTLEVFYDAVKRGEK